jgi:hypothetical protein
MGRTSTTLNRQGAVSLHTKPRPGAAGDGGGFDAGGPSGREVWASMPLAEWWLNPDRFTGGSKVVHPLP